MNDEPVHVTVSAASIPLALSHPSAALPLLSVSVSWSAVHSPPTGVLADILNMFNFQIIIRRQQPRLVENDVHTAVRPDSTQLELTVASGGVNWA